MHVSLILFLYSLVGVFVSSWQNVALVNANGAITRFADPGIGPGSAEQATSSALCKVTAHPRIAHEYHGSLLLTAHYSLVRTNDARGVRSD